MKFNASMNRTLNIEISYTPDLVSKEAKQNLRVTEKELFRIISSTLSELERKQKAFKELDLGGTLAGKMVVVSYQDLARKPMVKLDFPIIHYPQGSLDWKILWRAEILVDERDWVYLNARKSSSSPFKDELKQRFDINSHNELRL